MENLTLDRNKKIMLLRWLQQGYIPLLEIHRLNDEAMGIMKQQSDEAMIEEMIRIDKQMDGEEIGGYRLHYLPERYEKINSTE